MKKLTTNTATYIVLQNADDTLFVTKDGVESIPNAGQFIMSYGGIQGLLDACEEVEDPVCDGQYHGLLVVYRNGPGCYGHYKGAKYEAVVHELNEAISAIETWHTYCNPNYSTIIVNENAKAKLIKCIELAKRGELKRESMKSTNCGSNAIEVYPAMADTLGADRIIRAVEIHKKRMERIRIANEEREQRMTEMYQVRRGWYSVMMTFSCYYWSNRRGEMLWGQKEFSGKVIANSQLDAYNKACHDIEVNSDPFKCQGPEFPDPTNQSMFDAYFLGMKTDEGYSLEAWEEFSKTDEYKESVK